MNRQRKNSLSLRYSTLRVIKIIKSLKVYQTRDTLQIKNAYIYEPLNKLIISL